jgi:hypothetical protein
VQFLGDLHQCRDIVDRRALQLAKLVLFDGQLGRQRRRFRCRLFPEDVRRRNLFEAK